MSESDGRTILSSAAAPRWLCRHMLGSLEAVRDGALAWGSDVPSVAAEVRAAATALLPALPQTMVDEALAAVLPGPGNGPP